ncbi:MAG: helix-turn-helix domain-containing protein [Actinomycetota bacterium]
MPAAKALEIHKALADDTRFRLYRYLRLSQRPVSVRELATRLSLHPNTLRPHLRRLQEAGLLKHEIRRATGVGRPQTLYSVVEPEAEEGRDYRLVSEILCGLVTGKKAVDRAGDLAREWGRYLLTQESPKPGKRLPARRNLAMLQEAMARAGFDPRFRRRTKHEVEVLMRECPARDLTDDYKDLICTVHRGLVEGMLESLAPRPELEEFEPLVERATCRLRLRD